MSIQISKAIEPLDEMRAMLAQWPDDPTDKNVHALRKAARRAEAVADLLDLHREPQMSQAWKRLDSLRRSAGKARDLDVLKGLVESLATSNSGTPCVEELLQHILAMRRKAVQTLNRKIQKHGKYLARGLAKCLEYIQGSVEDRDAAQPEKNNEDGLNKQATKLYRAGRVTSENAHRFRIKVKKLRDMLELFDDANGVLLKTLTSIKDDIGTWHDWHEVVELAEDTLDAREGRQCIQSLKQIRQEKLKQALSSANKLNMRTRATAFLRRTHVDRM